MKRIVTAGITIAACLALAQCPAPWHTFDNPVDPDSPTYIGTPSRDNNGNGIPQYVDVEEMELVSPADGEQLATATPVLKTYRFDPALVKRYWIEIATDGGFSSDLILDESSLPANVCTVPAGILNNNTVYFWRAKAFDGTKWSSDWCEPRSFTIHLDLGVAGNPVPPDGVKVGDATPDLDWSDVAGADGYEIEIDDSSAMEAPFLVENGSLVESGYPVS